MNNLKLISGKVEDTLVVESNLPEKISILRLDTDWYESTKVELEVLFPRLERGDVFIIDDYGHFAGSRKAVDEFFEERYTSSYGCTALITHAGFISSSSFYLPSEDSVERIRKLVIMVGDP